LLQEPRKERNAMSTRTSRLTRETAAVLLVDHQVGLILGSRNPDPLVLRKNTVGLARAAQLLNVPVVVTTTMAEGMFGPLFQELADLVPADQVINRRTVNAWDEPRVVDAVDRTRRPQLIVAGINTAVCTCLPALSAKAAGYEVYVALDASGAFDETERLTALLRMTQGGVIVADFNALVAEMIADNSDPRAAEVYGVVRQSHAASLADVYMALTRRAS
jgi:nicotinamidase-related amidase